MGRRRGYTGHAPGESHNHSRMTPPPQCSTNARDLTRTMATYFWTLYGAMNNNYLAVITVFVVVVLSFILPDISQKIHRTQELKAMKKAVDLMTKEVSRAEVACLTVAEQIGCLQCSMQDGTTETSRNQQNLALCTSEAMRTTQSAPLPVATKTGFFRRIFSLNKNTSNKEITLMSYLYTDSFDANNAKTEEAAEI